MAAGTYHSGIKGTATVGGTELSAKGWSVGHNIVLQEFVNSKTATIPTHETTWNRFTVNITLDYDFSANPFGSLHLYAGQALTNVILYMNGSTDTTNAYTFPKLTVEGSPVQVEVAGGIGYSIACRVNGGPVTLPGGVTVT